VAHNSGLDRYRQVFANRAFLRFWVGFTISSLGDAMTRVALIWYVFERTDSARALGLFSVAYTGPVIVGGLLAGWLLDRFPRQRVMQMDALVRGIAVGIIPLLHALGRLELWHLYAVAAVYGLLMMISLAGGPTIVPSLVPREQLVTSNALEQLSFTLSGVVGPPLAGLLIALVGAPNVLVLDSISYFGFALALAGIHLAPVVVRAGQRFRLSDAFRLFTHNPIIRATTLMFMGFNIGLGALYVVLPIYAERVLDGGASLYGLLLGCVALGQVISSWLAGSYMPPLPLGRMICVAQLAAGVTLLLLIPGQLLLAVPSLLLFGVCMAPLTIWAQTLRMQIIPEALRGRTFALLRMMMQGANPVGGALGGLLLPAFGIPVMILLAGIASGAPGFGGLQSRALREAGAPPEVAPASVEVG
jgi:MFS family permease